MDWIYVIQDVTNKRVRALKVIKETPTRYYLARAISNQTVMISGGLDTHYITKGRAGICATPEAALARYHERAKHEVDRAQRAAATAKANVAWAKSMRGSNKGLADFVIKREAAIDAKQTREYLYASDTPC